MSAPYTGGPAFPCDDVFGERGVIIKQSAGMSLRDYFAAKAIQAVYISTTGSEIAARALHKAALVDGVTPEQHMAVVAYRMADAMLKERAK